jgi:hypothetical protein
MARRDTWAARQSPWGPAGLVNAEPFVYP